MSSTPPAENDLDSQEAKGPEPRATILIVEDDPECRLLMEILLEEEGYTTVAARNGKEALDLLDLTNGHPAQASSPGARPDLVLLDILMPGLNGHQVCERIKQDERLSHLPVIMVTALDSSDNKVRGLEQGADDYITKPFEKEELLARVRAQLRTKRLYDQSVRAQESLRKSEAQYRLLAENARDIIWTLDVNQRFTYVSPSIKDLLGYQAEDVIGKHLDEVLTPSSLKVALETLEDALDVANGDGPDERTVELEHRCKNGSTVWAEVRATLVRNAEGESARVLGVSRDITERRQAEKALRQSKQELERRERFLARVLSSIPSSLVVIDRSLDIVSANRNFLKKMRRDLPTTVGQEIAKVFPSVLMSYTELGDKVRQVFRTGQPLDGGSLTYRAPGLPNRVYYYRLVPLGTDDRVESVMLLMDDVTEQERLREEAQRSERHLASVVECANDLVISLDPQGHVVTWNQAAERTSGLRSEQVRGRPLSSLCIPEQRQQMTELLTRLTRGESVRMGEIGLVTADGQEVPIAWSCSTMRDDAGDVAGIVAVGRDLTERHQLQAQLIQSAKMASLGVMAGGIAHEVRNPLAIISASAQLLRERPDDARLRAECVEKVYSATERASQIIESLLRFARPKGEKTQHINLLAVLEETLDILAHQLALQNVRVRKAFPPDLPTVVGNPELLQQVFTNLILNARHAMPNGGTLTIRASATDRQEVTVAFEDTGRGIPPENVDKVFDPFFTTMPVGTGVGLGLAISYSIIQQHHGTIDIESEVGEGSTFTVWLPINGGGEEGGGRKE
jgi:PAS domain S-box-containing protein